MRLAQENIGYRTISGSMTLARRTKEVEAFQKDPPATVFLLSVRSGAVGINLTAASHVFLLEPLLNPALEAQAIGRSWRMGQTREVRLVRPLARAQRTLTHRRFPPCEPGDGAQAVRRRNGGGAHPRHAQKAQGGPGRGPGVRGGETRRAQGESARGGDCGRHQG